MLAPEQTVDTEEAIILDEPHSDPAGPRVQLCDALEPDKMLLVKTSDGHTERLLPWFMEALEAGRFVIETGREEPHTLTFWRQSGPAYWTNWRGERRWQGRGLWYVNAYVKGCGSNGSGTINLYLGKAHRASASARATG